MLLKEVLQLLEKHRLLDLPRSDPDEFLFSTLDHILTRLEALEARIGALDDPLRRFL